MKTNDQAQRGLDTPALAHATNAICGLRRRAIQSALLLLIGLSAASESMAQNGLPPERARELDRPTVPNLEPFIPQVPGFDRHREPSLRYNSLPRETNEPTPAKPGQKNLSNEELGKKVQSRLGPGFDPEKARHLLQNAPHSAEARETLAAIKSAAKPLLRGEPNLPSAAKSLDHSRLSAKDMDKAIPRKAALDPLPPPPSGSPLDCERTSRLDELRARAAAETNSFARERLLLDVAGHHVGQNDWRSAKAIYDELAARSHDPSVLEAVRNNLRVTDKKLEALAETNPARRERLELELATIHHELGHDRASKRLSEGLAQKAGDESVRKSAAGLLQAPSRPLPPWSAPETQAPKGSAR